MTPDLQTRLAAIKAECEEIIALRNGASIGPWRISDYNETLIKSGDNDVMIVECPGGWHCYDEINNAAFTAKAANVSPAMARVVLGTLITAEKLKDMEGGDMWLESIANQWEGK